MAKYREEEDELDDEEDRYFSKLEDEEDAFLADLYDAPEVIDFGDDDDEILDDEEEEDELLDDGFMVEGDESFEDEFFEEEDEFDDLDEATSANFRINTGNPPSGEVFSGEGKTAYDRDLYEQGWRHGWGWESRCEEPGIITIGRPRHTHLSGKRSLF
jgi:hypothetical protein